MELKIVKRNGETEPYNVDKIHQFLEFAVDGITGVSISDIEMRMNLQLANNMTTRQINSLAVHSAEELVSEECPNYQYVVSRILISELKKDVFGSSEIPRLVEVIRTNVAAGVYDKEILSWYTEDELIKIGSYVKHERDYKLSGAAVKQILDKYLVQNRATKQYYETPQIMFMMIGVVVFRNYPPAERMRMIKECYDALSKFKISLPTPILAGVRTSLRQFSSCVLIDIGDDLDSITDGAKSIVKYASKRAGLGINGGRIRAEGSTVRNGEVVHTGVTPYYRLFESAVKCCSQGGIRDASVTLYAPVWHLEIENILSLKSNKVTNEKAVRRMDYAIQWDNFLLRRARNQETMTLFSPHEVPDLYNAYFAKDRSVFEKLYLKYENDKSIKMRSTVNARDVLVHFLKESMETGRYYSFSADHVNTHSVFKEPIYMSNLCLVGDTKICVADDAQGKNRRIVNLDTVNVSENIFVLSKSLDSDTEEWNRITNFAQTSPSENTITIEDEESGIKFTCTECHLVYTKNRGYVEAGQLEENDELDISKIFGDDNVL